MIKMFVYNFNGYIYETAVPFDDTYRRLKADAIANGESFSRQVIVGDKITNEKYLNGVWVREC